MNQIPKTCSVFSVPQELFQLQQLLVHASTVLWENTRLHLMLFLAQNALLEPTQTKSGPQFAPTAPLEKQMLWDQKHLRLRVLGKTVDHVIISSGVISNSFLQIPTLLSPTPTADPVLLEDT
jgi:hypothetical protein